MEKIKNYLPFVLMILGSFQYGSTHPVRTSALSMSLIIILGHFFSIKPSSYQKEIRIGVFALSIILGISFFLKIFNIKYLSLNWVIFLEYVSIALGCFLYILGNKASIAGLIETFKKKQ
jgi:hypothetical protein